MRKVFITTIFVLVVLASLFAADNPTNIKAVSVTVASIVKEPPTITPSISVSFRTNFSYSSTIEGDSMIVNDLDLTQDGSFSFNLLTSEEINIFGIAQRSALSIEIAADGFHLYDEPTQTNKEGFSLSQTSIKERNAVPITSLSPAIDIPNFSGADENVSVSHVNGQANKIEITFNPGKTKADLVLGTFRVDWKGKEVLEEGIYKAEVMVSYSTL